MKIITYPGSAFGGIAALIFSAGILIQPAHAQGPLKKKSQNDLENRISENRIRLEQRQLRPDQAIPRGIFNAAHGIIIMHHVKAGLGFGAELGNGVALVRNRSGQWSPPAFVSMNKGSWGLQIGADESVTIMVLMTEESLRILRDGGAGSVGASLDATAGPLDASADAGSISLRKPVLIYSDSKGAFAGATISAGGIVSSKKKNQTAYGTSMETILFSGQVPRSPAGELLIKRLNEYSGRVPVQAGPGGY